jgi:thiamine kinase-like enzyme
METPKCILLKSNKEKKLLKLFRTENSRNPFNKKYKNSSAIQKEFESALAINKIPINKPMFYGKINIKDRTGFIYEYIEGETVSSLVHSHKEENPVEYKKYASYVSSLHKEILKQKCPKGVLSWKEDMRPKICKSPFHTKEVKQHAVKLIDSLPDSDRLCHGSLHNDNVLVSNETPYAIDFATITSGPALYDIAKAIYSTRQEHNKTLHQKNDPDGWELMLKQRKYFSICYMEQMGVCWEDIQDYYYLINICKKGRAQQEYQMPDGQFFRK